MKFFNKSNNSPSSITTTVSASLMFSLIQAANAQDQNSADGNNLSPGTIVGITVGVGATVCATIACCLCLYRKMTGQNQYQSMEQDSCDAAGECLRTLALVRC